MRAEKKKSHGDRYRDVGGIIRIVREGLCHRCGACIGICPAGTFDVGPGGYPVQVGKCVECDKCVQVCSGIGVDYPVLGAALYGEGYRYGQFLGPVKAAYVGYSLDDEIRWRGTSGGLVTQLLVHLLESGRITGALVVVNDPGDPAMAKGVIARSREELMTAAQSKYTTSPSLAALRDLKGEKGRIAVVCVPCQVHALRKAFAFDRKLGRRISLVIGLYCHFKLDDSASRELAAVTSRGRHARRVWYRRKDGQGWPHNTVEIDFSDGSHWRSPLGPADTVNILSHVTPLGRCLTCLDVTSELADISVGDPWIRNEEGRWKYSAPGGLSSVIARSKEGEAALRSAVEAGRISLKPIPAEEIEAGQHAIMDEKKNRIPFRLALMRFAGRRVPAYPMPLPPADARIVLQESIFLLLRLLPALGPVRRLLLRLAFSPWGQGVMRRRRAQKGRKAAAQGKKEVKS
jgi:coenzyme F420 hydrogenase subunit beta